MDDKLQEFPSRAPTAETNDTGEASNDDSCTGETDPETKDHPPVAHHDALSI